jgi:mannose-6-phosphate isomerase
MINSAATLTADLLTLPAHLRHTMTVTLLGPLRFESHLRPLVWGGRRLGELLGKPLPDAQAHGESWEISDHASYASRVATGPLAGTSLRQLMTQHHRALLGPAADRFAVFPWLVKHLDAYDWLSVQVHPDDEHAKKWWPGEGGKTEVWFILEALPGSRVYAGLRPGVDQQALRAALAAGTLPDCLHSFQPRAGDCIFLPAGTVHAVGGGVLMAEIQQTSDATFRLFDWNRKDAQGRSRALHIEEGLACVDWHQGPVKPVHAVAFSTTVPASRPQKLASCRYFDIEIRRDAQAFPVGGQGRLQLLVPVAGSGVLTTPYGPQELAAGQAWLLPALAAAEQCLPRNSLACLICTLPD